MRTKSPLGRRALRYGALQALLRRYWVTAFDIVVACVWIALIGSVVRRALPEDAIGSTPRSRTIMRQILPEGWAFFTRDAREKTHRVFIETEGHLEPANNADVRKFGPFGANRKSRVNSIATGLVLAKIPKDSWTACKQPLDECAAQLTKKPVEVELTMKVAPLCGRMVIQETAPVPWAWRHSYGRVSMPSRIVRANVRCS